MIGPARIRQLKKTFNNAKTTLLCGLITLLVLRGTIGFGGGTTHVGGFSLNNLHRFVITVDGDTSDGDVSSSNSNLTLFSPKISNWDSLRREWLQTHPSFPASRPGGRPTVMLVTGTPPGPCENPEGDHYLLKSIKNKVDYCRLHGLQMHHSMSVLDSRFENYWAKIPLIRRLMISHPEIEWFWWMDHDAIFTDMEFDLPMHKYGQVNMVVPGYSHLIFENKSWVGINMGSYLVRNSQWTLDLFETWGKMGRSAKVRELYGKLLSKLLQDRPENFDADDQSAFIYLLLGSPEKSSSSRERTWKEKVYIENSYDLHGFWVGLVDRYEEMVASGRRPLVTHFVGCKTCGSYADYSMKKCLAGMERAFNVADDQVLRKYGFRHANWSSSQIERVVVNNSPPARSPANHRRLLRRR